MHKTAIVVLALASCTPDYAHDFAGAWILSSGQYRETCQGRVHDTEVPSGYLQLRVEPTGPQAVRANLRLNDGGSSVLECALMGAASSDRIDLEARVCRDPNPYYFTGGTLSRADKGTLLLEWTATTPNLTGTCSQSFRGLLLPNLP